MEMGLLYLSTICYHPTLQTKFIQINHYHRDCYSSLCNTTKLERAEKRYKNALEKSNTTLIVPKIDRPSTSATSSASNNNNNDNKLISTSSKKVLRSSGTLFNSDLCIICQKPEGKLRTVALANWKKHA